MNQPPSYMPPPGGYGAQSPPGYPQQPQQGPNQGYGQQQASQGYPQQGPHGYGQAPMGELRVHTSHSPMMWVLYLVNSFIELNGQKQSRPWGWSSFPVAAGHHQLRVGFNYLFGPAGTAMRMITIHPGCITEIRYSAPSFIVFMSGDLFELPPRPIQALPGPRY
jgi:hypothetical protein